ncbi:hypothetical protein KUCAC02_032180, partial [Chaenocephalus aceratus]
VTVALLEASQGRPRSDVQTRVYGEDVWGHIAAKEDVLWLIRTVIQQEQSLRSSSCIMDKIQDSQVEGRRKPTACFPSWSLFVLLYYSGTYRGGGVDQHDGVGGCSGLVGRTLTKRFPDPSVALRENRKAQQLQQDGRTDGWVSNATLSQECFTSDNPEFTFHIESNASD